MDKMRDKIKNEHLNLSESFLWVRLSDGLTLKKQINRGNMDF